MNKWINLNLFLSVIELNSKLWILLDLFVWNDNWGRIACWCRSSNPWVLKSRRNHVWHELGFGFQIREGNRSIHDVVLDFIICKKSFHMYPYLDFLNCKKSFHIHACLDFLNRKISFWIRMWYGLISVLVFACDVMKSKYLKLGLYAVFSKKEDVENKNNKDTTFCLYVSLAGPPCYLIA